STAQPTRTVTGNPAPSSTTVTGLTNGTTYTFTVTASNPNGTSGASTASNAVTPSASLPIVQTGAFDRGPTPWATGGVQRPTVTWTQARGGTKSALLGAVQPATQPNGDSTLSQSLVVPTGISQLTFWTYTGTADDLCSGSACSFDWQEARIQDSQGNL